MCETPLRDPRNNNFILKYTALTLNMKMLTNKYQVRAHVHFTQFLQSQLI